MCAGDGVEVQFWLGSGLFRRPVPLFWDPSLCLMEFPGFQKTDPSSWVYYALGGWGRISMGVCGKEEDNGDIAIVRWWNRKGRVYIYTWGVTRVVWAG